MAKRTKSKFPADFRFQGTDGIRSEAKPAAACEPLSPQRLFCEKRVITERFMELYAYAYIRLLISEGAMQPGEPVVIGWDPRDVDGIFTDAAVNGIRKAGGAALVLGIVPTPLVPMFMLWKRARGGLMITASHNPKDQNGIKIFRAGRGMKLLPRNDIKLTRFIFNCDYSSIAAMQPAGERVDCREEALDMFIRFSLNPANSWKGDVSFRDICLVVDPANGALTDIAARVFRDAGFGKVIEVNNRLNGDVNLNSGVADLEGHKTIPPQTILRGSGAFHKHAAVLQLFALGRKYRKDIAERTRRVCGAVFDADGDRFYCLEYNPVKDSLIVLGGDETAFLQGRYLMKRDPRGWKGALYFNTVESDLNAARAAQKLGFKPQLTAVGDKWILLRIVHACIESRLNVLLYANQKTQAAAAKLLRRFEQIKNSGVPDVESLESIETALDRLEKSAGKTGYPVSPLRFAIGSEETGHNITRGWLYDEIGASVAVFSGNGLKSALNTFAASQYLFRGKPAPALFARLEQPFPPGFKKTHYAYYVRKELFRKNSPVWRNVARTISAAAKKSGFRCKTVNFPDDPDMLYISMSVKGSQEAALFVRNSGTENKIGINLRCRKKYAARLQSIGESVARVLFAEMKDADNEWRGLELEVLKKLENGAVPENRLGLQSQSSARLLPEMKKQNLIELAKGGCRLTHRGRWYFDKTSKTG